MCQWKEHWKSVKISDFCPSLSVESWFCSNSCPPLVWKHDLLRNLQSLSKHFAIASTFLHVSLSSPQVSLSRAVYQWVLLDQCLIKMRISLFVPWALLQQNVNQFQVGQCLQLWTLETFTSEIILPCCLLLYFKQVYHELTSVHIYYECVWTTPVCCIL